MQKLLSAFAVVGGGPKRDDAAPEAPGKADFPDDNRMEAAMGELEREFSNVDENDPRAMGRMMRRMADLTGEGIDGPMEEVVRKLEEGADPDSLEEDLGGDPEGGVPAPTAPEARGARRSTRARRTAPVRDPKLYEFP